MLRSHSGVTSGVRAIETCSFAMACSRRACGLRVHPLFLRVIISPGNLLSGQRAIKKKKQCFPRLSPTLPNSVSLPSNILVLVGKFQPQHLSRGKAKLICAEHSCLVGATNPCPSAVHMEPFSTSPGSLQGHSRVTSGPFQGHFRVTPGALHCIVLHCIPLL